MNDSDKKDESALACAFGFVILAIAAFLLFSIVHSHVRPVVGRFGDAALGRFYATAICAVLIPALVISGQLLVCKGSRSKKLRLPGWILGGLTVAAMMVLLSSVLHSMRPVPKYDPKNYQHLIGCHLRDARSELDTKHSVSGAGSGNGISYRSLSFRGMELVATPDGIITEVKKGLRD